ncbi:MAG: HAMP domain-containing sensor histidine kinase [Ignavibacteriaceae bacterium]|jgi:nitrogen-specific signal transduction histidine kinase|nr:HAMP domain-containing sensor histidine kinase [Ignavibacteriaceae bacterium]
MQNNFDLYGGDSSSLTELSSYKELPDNKSVVIFNSNLDIIYANETFSRIFRLGVSDSIYKLHPNAELLMLVKGFSEKSFKNFSSEVLLNIADTKDTCLCNVWIERVIIASVQYLVVSIESLEQRKIIEDKIIALHNALDYGKVPIIITDKYQRIIFATKTVESLFSKDIDGLYYQTIFDLLREYISFEEHQKLSFAIEKKQRWKSLINISKRNVTEYWEFNLEPFTTNDELDTSYILSASNLTEYIYQKQIIEESEKRQKLILQNISDLLLIIKKINDDYYFENANDNFCIVFNINKDRYHLAEISKVFPEKLVIPIKSEIQNMIKNESPFSEFDYLHSAELDYHCKITTPLELSADTSMFIVTMKDITEEKNYRIQLEKGYMKEMLLNKMKSDFLANISHEIRTPFNGIVGYSEIIDDCIENQDYESLKEMVDSMKEVLGRSLSLFNNLVEVSQIESGEIEIERVDLNGNQVLRQVYERKIKDAGSKKLEFVIDLCEEDCMIEVDWVKLERIFDVLIDNAIKYTNQGGVYIGSLIVDQKVNLIVKDTGIGIEKSQIERVLAPFNQEIEGYTRPYEGVGLGLTIASKLTKLMGGDFKIESEKNKGTSITITFPQIDSRNFLNYY